MIVIILAAGGAGAYFVLKGKTEKQIIETSKQIEKQKDINTSVWKTYRNAGYGYEFRYPSTYEVYYGPNGLTITEKDILVGVIEDYLIKETNIEDFIKQETDRFYQDPTKGLGDSSSIAFSIPERITTDENSIVVQKISGQGIGTRVIVPEKGLELRIFYEDIEKVAKGKFDNFLKGLINTLEFIESQKSIDTSEDWKTYRSEKYGFEFKYPMFFSKRISKDEFSELMLATFLNQSDGEKTSLLFEGYEGSFSSFKRRINIQIFDQKVNEQTLISAYHDFLYLEQAKKIVKDNTLTYLVGPDTQMQSPCKIVRAFTPKNNTTIFIALESCSGINFDEGLPVDEDWNIKRLLIEIISTFKFIEP